MRTLPLLLVALSAGAQIPPPEQLLDSAQQALVVTTADWNSVQGTLRRFEGRPGAWHEVGGAIPVVVGKNGLAWDGSLATAGTAQDPVKHEGDGRSPAGIFPIPVEFGFGDAGIAQDLKYSRLTDQTECVDDVNSRSYNEVVNRNDIAKPDWNSSEKMRGVGGYRIGAIVGYNSAQKPGNGSCIFLHIWSAPDHGTAGCTAMEEAGLRSVLQSLDSKKRPILIQMPAAKYQSLRKAWRLP